MPAVSSAALVTLAAGVVAATIVDLRTRRIPNRLTAAMAASGIALAAAGASGITLWGAALGLLVGMGLMLPGHLFGATGAGDVKLMAAIGAIVGPATVVSAFLFTAIVGGVLAVAVAIGRRRLAVTLAGTGSLVTTPARARQAMQSAGAARRFAYGPAIAIGSLIAVFIG